ncbi:MAG TPA: TolC family protein [Bryobacteraceae bacterium]|nr:TolC family protein [Bryobacteraceae bacterium]
MNRNQVFRISAIILITGLSAQRQQAAESRRLTLTEAVQLAIKQNHALKIARLKVFENEQKKAGERSAYFPSITNQTSALHITDLQSIVVPAGTFGNTTGVTLPQGQKTFFSSGTQISQPITQLIRIRQANAIAAAETAASRDDLKKAENQVALQVHTLYYGILITRLQKNAAEQQTAYAGELLRENEDDVRNGNALKMAAIQGRAGLLESQQSVLTAQIQLDDLSTELNDLLGLPLDTKLDLNPAVPATFELSPEKEYVQAAWSDNPEILAAEEAVRKARSGVTAAKSAYIPDVTAWARESYQDGVPFLTRNFGTVGVSLSYDIFDFGKRRAAVRERDAQLAQAEENLQRLKDQVAVGVEKSYNKLTETRNLVRVADQVVKLRQEAERLAQNQLAHGVVLLSARRQSTAATFKAQADYLQASLGYLLAWAELEQTVGRTPGL